MNILKKKLSVAFGLAALASSAYSVDIQSVSGGGNWNVSGTWVGGAIPGASDTALLRSGGTVYNNAQQRSVQRIALGIGATNVTLNVGSSGTGTITTSAGPNNFGQNTSGTSTFNLQGGAFTATNDTYFGANTGGTGIMVVNVTNAATLSLANTVIGNATTGGTLGRLNVFGDAATVSFGNTTINSAGTLSFVFSASGFSQVNMLSLAGVGGTLNLDLTNYTGALGDFTIIDADSDSFGVGLASSFSSTSVFGGNYAGSYVTQDLSTSLITLTIVPEPGTYALMGGLLALSFVMLRRRR